MVKRDTQDLGGSVDASRSCRWMPYKMVHITLVEQAPLCVFLDGESPTPVSLMGLWRIRYLCLTGLCRRLTGGGWSQPPVPGLALDTPPHVRQWSFLDRHGVSCINLLDVSSSNLPDLTFTY